MGRFVMNKNIIFCITFFLVIISLYTVSCAPKVITNSNRTEEKSDDCSFMDELCKEASDFEKEYQKLPEKEKKEMLPVLNNYIKLCEDARKKCIK